jgi:peptidoglycan/LPS O-acetylase OafA/YrhL
MTAALAEYVHRSDAAVMTARAAVVIVLDFIFSYCLFVVLERPCDRLRANQADAPCDRSHKQISHNF